MDRLTVWLILRTSAAVVSGVAFLLTLFLRDWIEVVFRIDPDRGSGALEWLVAGAFLGAAFLFGTSARATWTTLRCDEPGGLSR